ncbi:DDT domain-containing protein PTM-like [Cucurbita pepo subsp. pepo]|uniref:DDT domain-containing protein PTM-like n=1 Tax=Cucurbita pepo subsp. pepo TaxID=3664 RepID=UPI000C9D5071|nr:DDT domain-containing protein PTM-like [Cucurbita pepo subsp. pepo]XP_023533644.1 DDT domain-containing protein PTM-like [Cucurbita pepo subsp. pepo]
MEPPVVRSRGRPRKRRNNELEDGTDEAKSGLESCKRTLVSRPVALLGRYLLKEFKGSGKYLGKVVYYEEGLYRVVYEDGDNEDLESREIRGLLIDDPYPDDGLNKRKKRLDELAVRFSAKNTNVTGKNTTDITEKVDPVEASVSSKLSSEHIIENDDGEVEVDVDSSSDSSESVLDRDFEFEDESLLIPPPQLPPSSGTIGIQEQHVSHLLSVYGFLRSFSFRLFLFPFSLDDFVGSLNCGVPNTLLDSIHVALMCALRGHLEILSSDGLEIATKCLRHFNWSLLDSLTWPVYLVQYLTVMGCAKGLEWNGFYKHALSNEYYSIPAGRKLMVLQILCDEVLKSGELRAEIDVREISEVGLEYDAGATCLSENGPRRVHPRYPKTSACKDGEAIEIIVENHGMKSYTDQNFLGTKCGTNGDLDASVVDANRNSDECRLCGMDGSLLCCDGCPSAYHLRCIGMMKILIPQGPWYCPECSINKTEPAITKGSLLRGAEIFGIDPHEHIFLGSCNHLVVLKTSISSEPCVKYYNQNDILNVLHVLCSSSQYIAIYYGICKAIMQYWNIPENLLVLPETSGMDILPANLRKDTNFYAQSLPVGEEEHKEKHDVVEDRKDLATCKIEDDNKVVSYLGTLHGETSRDPPAHQVNGFVVDSLASNCSISRLENTTDLACSDMVDISSTTDLSRTSGNKNFSHTGNGNASISLNLSRQSQNGSLLGGRNVKDDIKSTIRCAYMGSQYKPQGYVNHYVHGEFAASAAHKLDVLSSEETRVSGTHASDNKRSSSTSAYALLQAKAFSLSASRFFWPTFDKKLMEVPRERCGWCLSCRAAVLSKKGCLLNHAALTATRGAMKILSSLRLGKNGEGNLSCIAVYILYMEESLRGLVGGTFLNASYRKQWRHQLESALSCSLIKFLLLELEENIRSIALSSNWFKLVDDWFLETSMIQNAPGAFGTTVQKRGPGRRRKQSVSEDPSHERSDANFLWFRGGISKLVFQRAALPRCIVAKAARQGGLRKISGIHYTDGSEIPRRSRQFVWRAAVEASKNVSQLALQLRNLDFHLRWSDLVRPEQTLQDMKGQETEASIFRNARISDKKVVENKIAYGVAFGSQKHLPSRVMKNAIEIEQKQDGSVAYWFLENCIPLYLVKEYEEGSIQVNFSSPKVYPNLMYQSRRRRLKSYQRDIFFYLTCRRDNMGLLSCSSCRMEVLIRNAVKCSSCQGYCHVNCTVRLTTSGTEDVACPITCKQCCHLKALNRSGNSTESPTSPLPSQGKEHRSSSTLRKGARPKDSNQPSATPVNKLEPRSEKKQATPLNKLDNQSEKKQVTPTSSAAPKSKRRNCSWGIIWKKKNCEDTGANFRHNYLLLKGGRELHHMEPVCHLCSKPYRSDLMYICCETCKNWYHAEAVALEESKIFDVVGYKCCRCRRIKSPECPYMDPKPEKQDGGKKARPKSSKQENSGVECDDLTISDSKKLETSSSLLHKEEVNPFIFSLSRVELIAEPNSGLDDDWNAAAGGQAAPQKLPVRRQTKPEDDEDGFSQNYLPHSQSSIPIQHETDTLLQPVEKSSSFSEWDNSGLGFEEEGVAFDFDSFNYDDMDFGPQTYFSFTELLAPDDASGDVDDSFPIVDIDIPNQGFSEQLEPAEPAVVNCQICTNLEPVPDLVCQVCGLQIHSHCSPWDDAVSTEEKWSCGRCREWQ